MKFANSAWGRIGAGFLFLGMGMAWAQTAKTPPMGWNSWNHFGCGTGSSISETLFKTTADAMVASGMKDAGYTYLNVDDCWHGSRDANGYIHASANFTGNSMQSLSDYVHGKGLKFGIYTCAGTKTCASFPGSLGYEGKDMEQYAKWGVDYVKVDWCSITPAQLANPKAAYQKFSDSIQKYDPVDPMLLSVCNWGQLNPWVWGRSAGGQLWRTTADIALGWTSFTGILDQQANLWRYAGPGGWNDPDMLEVGRGMSLDEDKSHFGMWCLLAAPLIAGNDLTNMTTATKTILTNTDLIAVNQDPLGFQAQRVAKNGDLEVWARPLNGNARAVGLFNRSAAAATITLNWADLAKWDSALYPWSATKIVSVRDLWTHADVATNLSGNYSTVVASHGLAVFKLYDPSNAVRFRLSPHRGIEVETGWVRLDFPGSHALRILDLNGRVLWSRRGEGSARYRVPGLGTDGVRVLQIETPQSRAAVKY